MSAGDRTPGRRIESPYTQDGGLIKDWPQAGDYFYYRGSFRGVTPNGVEASLANHDVTEHEDGTITARPSILCRQGVGGKRWHGYLERGVWREVE
jgi:hypothetical protein